MRLIKTIKEIISDSIMESREAEYRILKKTFQNNTDKLYQYLVTRGSLDDFMEDILQDDDDETRELHRMVISSFIKSKDWERLLKYSLIAFSDLEDTDGKLTMTLGEKGDLSQFFYKDRDVSEDAIKSIIVGDNDGYGYWDDSIDLRTFEGIVDDLNDSNLSHLRELVKGITLSKKVSYSGDNAHLEDIIDSDGGLITKDALEEVFRNNDNLADFIFNTDELMDIRDNMERIYNYSNDYAINDENYENVMTAIEDFFGDTGSEFNTGRKRTVVRKDGTRYSFDDIDYKIGISNELYTDVIQWWVDMDYNDLDYWGSFEEMLKEYCSDLSYSDSMSFRWSDYPDSGKVRDNMNEIFLDYIEE